VKLQFKKRRLIPVAIAMAAVIAVSGVAYAYWTATGSGAGTAQAGTPSSLTVNQTSTITGLYPGGPAQALSGNFDNPNAYSVNVTAVTASVGSVSGNPGTCATTNFVVAGTSNVPGSIAAGNGTGAWSGLTVQLVETGANQDGCKGATVHLVYSAS
jgi:hypothetical protein